MLPLLIVSGMLADVALALPEARVIVKWRGDSPLAVKQALSAERSNVLARIANLNVRLAPEIAPRMQVVRASGVDSEELARRLAQQKDVEYAEPDRLKKIRALPSDGMYASQWYLQNTEIAAINAAAAWDITTGLPGMIVAVIDTGVRYSHPDLASKLLPGYDFVNSFSQAADGDAWDDNASDPGDGLTANDLATSTLAGCGGGPKGDQPVPSSWHGTKVAGILAAASNNGIGITGIGWGTRILPVRAMGKCGGFDSDIIAAMRWAAGLSVSGVPVNPNPARIINMSLGGQNSCSPPFRDAVAQLKNVGVLVVAAAGNNLGPVEEPGNCPGVLAVAGVRNQGNKVGFSSYGSEVGISAPAGNCINVNGPCLFPINTTSNTGEFSPGLDTYTDQVDYTVGTSFAAPMAAGVASLMWSVHDRLDPALLIKRLQNGARAFVPDSSLPTCPAVVPDTEIQSGQCNCTTSTCGAGLLNALGAVNEALRPVASLAFTGSATQGGNIVLDAAASRSASGSPLATYQWSASYGDGSSQIVLNADKPQASIVPAKAAVLVVTLLVRDVDGRSDSTSLVIPIAVGPGGNGSGNSGGNNGGGTTTPPAESGGGGGGGAFDAWALLLLAGGWLYQRRRCNNAASTVPQAKP